MVEAPIPANDEQIKHVVDKLAKRVKTLNNAKFKYRQLYSNVSLLLLISAAANTTVVTLSHEKEAYLFWGDIAIITSLIVAVLSGINGLFKPRDKHARNAEALNAIVDVRERLEWRLKQSTSISVAELDIFFSELRQIEKEFFSDLTRLELKES